MQSSERGAGLKEAGKHWRQAGAVRIGLCWRRDWSGARGTGEAVRRGEMPVADRRVWQAGLAKTSRNSSGLFNSKFLSSLHLYCPLEEAATLKVIPQKTETTKYSYLLIPSFRFVPSFRFSIISIFDDIIQSKGLARWAFCPKRHDLLRGAGSPLRVKKRFQSDVDRANHVCVSRGEERGRERAATGW